MDDELMSASPFAALSELAQGLAEHRWSLRELVALYLNRIEQANTKLHAFIDVYREQALAAADASDRLRQAGIILSPLHGVPIAVKDLLEWQGRPCSAGSKAWEGRISSLTATSIQRLLAAGMILLGKTHMVEFAFGGWGVNPQLGTPWNPWDLQEQRIPGGSSSGSGVAVAAALAPAALGSDTGGSVRIPAALNNLVGLKPSYGRVNLHGCVPLSTTLDSIGPMTRTVMDSALLLEIIAGHDPADPTTLNLGSLADWTRLKVSDMRIVVLDEDNFPMPLDADVLAVFRQAQQVLKSLGVCLKTCALPFDFTEVTEKNGLIIAAEAYAYHQQQIHNDDLAFGAAVRARILSGQTISAAQYIHLRVDQRHACAQYRDWMESFDALLTPTLPMTAIPLSEVDEQQTPLALFTRPANYLGACALTLPAGFSRSGLPIGIQLMGKPYAEASLLALGQAYEQATQQGCRQPDLSVLGL